MNSLERFPKRSLAEAWARKLRAPLKIRVAEDELDRWGAHCGTTGSDDSPRLNHIHHDLDIERPVAWVVEDEDGGYRRRRKVDWLVPVQYTYGR